MDKLNPTFQGLPVNSKSTIYASGWYATESTSGKFTPSELAWMQAQGWKVYSTITVGGVSTYAMSRRVIKPELVLNDLISDYTDAYNEGRDFNDKRYDDLLAIYIASLSITEDEYNALQTDDSTFEGLIEALITQVGTDYDTWSADVDGDLDAWGVDLLAEINARFDAELGKAKVSLIERGLYNATMWVTASAGVERERQRALNLANDQIKQRQLELKNKIFAEQVSLRSRVLAARDRLRVFLHGAKDAQVAARERASQALAAFVERRTDSYPSLDQVGRLAAALGGGSPQAFGG